ncbi:MAG: ATP-binding protein [Bryobacteraceae bacterium]|jgi:PAS domain S-box-containing protein
MPEKRWFWATLTLSCITLVSAVFAAWEVVENRFFRYANYVTLHYLYITRGIASSLLLAFWAAWFVLRQRRKSEEELRRSRERYRGLLEVFPGAVILYDSSRRVLEWNASAERMYGYGKDEVCGSRLPVIPQAKTGELEDFIGRVERGEPILDVETMRQPKDGEAFEVQLSLLPFRESAGPLFFLEVTSDIRERVRWRQRMLEIEKLTSMGKMAAGTAHHLNSPLTALLIRVQMMRQRMKEDALAADAARLEEGLNFCSHFVRQLLEFTRAASMQKSPQDVASVVESVTDFFLPALRAKRVALSVDVSLGRGRMVLADRNLLESLLLTLLSNALDAVLPGGEIRVFCRQTSAGRIGFVVKDNGCGISAACRERLFEPFFTTKEPGKGTGLGLAMAKNVVLEHSGTIELESHAGEGTTVYVDFPLAGVQPVSLKVKL